MTGDATELANAIRQKKISASEAMQASLDAFHATEKLGAISYINPSAGLKSATAFDLDPLQDAQFGGVPFLVKDLGGPFADWPVVAGSRAFSRSDGTQDSELANRFRSTGVCIFGMTTVPEFGLSLTSEPTLGPVCKNPHNPDLSAGGSSGGAAAAVAAGIVSIAHGTDAGGSIRVPAACCGLVGLKPSRGTIPGGPSFSNHLGGIASELTLCRSVRDVATSFNALKGKTKGPCPPEENTEKLPDNLRIGILRGTGEKYPTCETHMQVVEAAAISLAQDGHPQLEIDWRNVEPLVTQSATAFASIICVNLAEIFQAPSLDASKTEKITQAAIARGAALSPTELWTRLNSMVHVSHGLWQLFEDVDCIITPMLSSPPKPIGSFPADHSDIEEHFSRMTAFAPTASLANISGFPALTLPFGADTDGLPLPVQIIAPMGQDALLLHVAQRLEAEQRWQHPYPVAGLYS